VKVFWDDEKGHLADHIWTAGDGTEHPDWTCRPNQVIACALPNSPLPLTKQRSVLKVVKQKLLTPFGLRTLPVDDPGYHGKYLGDQFKRDSAYHQGTVWPWLIGPYASAVLRCGKFSGKAKEEAFEAISPLLEFMAGDGLGQLHEIHEGDVPHRPVGCPAQAWSVAEVLRVLRLIERGEE
jgi:glycogen debranching enzyme